MWSRKIIIRSLKNHCSRNYSKALNEKQLYLVGALQYWFVSKSFFFYHELIIRCITLWYKRLKPKFSTCSVDKLSRNQFLKKCLVLHRTWKCSTYCWYTQLNNTEAFITKNIWLMNSTPILMTFPDASQKHFSRSVYLHLLGLGIKLFFQNVLIYNSLFTKMKLSCKAEVEKLYLNDLKHGRFYAVLLKYLRYLVQSEESVSKKPKAYVSQALLYSVKRNIKTYRKVFESCWNAGTKVLSPIEFIWQCFATIEGKNAKFSKN